MKALDIYTVTHAHDMTRKTTYWLKFETLLRWAARDQWDYTLPERYQA